MSMAPLKKESGTLKSSMLFSISTRKRLDSSSKIISRIKYIVLGRQFMKNIGKIKKKQKKTGEVRTASFRLRPLQICCSPPDSGRSKVG